MNVAMRSVEVVTGDGLVPVCACCGKIRDLNGVWHPAETLPCILSDVEFTHGLCPECMHRLYPDIAGRTH